MKVAVSAPTEYIMYLLLNIWLLLFLKFFDTFYV